jgi:nucleoside-diphosphate-sugar epimerase
MAEHTDVSAALQANIVDLQYVLNESMKLGFAPDLFVYVSSSSVNLKHQTFYSNTKKAGELIVQSVPIPSCIIRPYTIIGVGEQEQHLIPTLIRSCFTGEEMKFVPDATHDYVDVDDVVSGILMLADQRRTGVFELGTGVEVSNQEIRELVEEGCGYKANCRIVDNLRSYDNKDWYCNEPAQDWSPRKSLRVSIAEMILAYKREYNAS